MKLLFATLAASLLIGCTTTKTVSGVDADNLHRGLRHSGVRGDWGIIAAGVAGVNLAVSFQP